jgi:hypothetical protein
VAIKSVRIYYYPTSEDVQRKLTRSHWGFADWFDCRLKPIRERLRGDEAKGVDIVNFMLYEPARAGRINEWWKCLNTFEYDMLFDPRELLQHEPLHNIRRLMLQTSEAAMRAPWPQVVAVGEVLAVPLSAQEEAEVVRYLQWPRATVNH